MGRRREEGALVSSLAMVWLRASCIPAIALVLACATVVLAPAATAAPAPAAAGVFATAHPEPGDVDGDEVLDGVDNCPTTPNGSQLNTDADAQGDACDADDDNDGVPDTSDNCRLVANPDQADTDGDPRRGDACPAADTDSDGVFDDDDNCPAAANPDQSDLNGDDQGNACDRDDDGDRYDDGFDNCPAVYNPDQEDADRDGFADRGDPDKDGLGSACDPDELIAGPVGAGPGTPGGAGDAGPGTPDGAADSQAPKLTLRVQRRQRMSEVGRSLVVTASCSEACTLDAVVSATSQAARRARLGRSRAVLARGTWALTEAGRTYVFARWTSTARRLRGGRSLVATLQLSATDAAGNRSRQSRRIELRR